MTLALTMPDAGMSAARRGGGAALSNLVRDLQHLPLQGRSGATRQDASTVLGALGKASRAAPGPMWTALRRTSVYVHLRMAADFGVDPTGESHLRRGLTALALELASAGALTSPLEVRSPVALPLRRSRGDQVRLRSGLPCRIMPDATVTQEGVTCATDPAFETIDGPLALALVDDNPLASFEAHPDKSGSQLDFGNAPPATWVRRLRDALGMVERAHPALRQELDRVVQQFVPVGTDDEKHLSASYREALGTIYLSLHPDDLTMAEAVIHEAQHNKLNAYLSVDPLLENAPDERYASPVRPDLRPLHGVLLAVHAFVPVAHFYVGLRRASDPALDHPRAGARIQRILRGNEEGMQMLEAHARTTSSGAELLAELRSLHDEATRLLA